MTPTSTRAQAALIGLSSVHLYKQAEGAGFLDTLKGYWDTQNDATKGALIGGAGGALVGGLTAPSGSALQRALLLGGVGAGIGGGLGYAGQVAKDSIPKGRAGGVDLESRNRFPGEEQKNIIERGLDKVHEAGAPAAAAIDSAGKDVGGMFSGIKSWMTGTPQPPQPGSPEATARAAGAELSANMQGKRDQASTQQLIASGHQPTSATDVWNALKRSVLGNPTKPVNLGAMGGAELQPWVPNQGINWQNQ